MKKHQTFTLTAVLAGSALALAACGGKSASTADYIGIDAAKEAALADAGVSADQAVFSSAGLDSRDGVFYYEVNFEENGTEYEYDIDAMTGVVIEKEQSGAQPSADGSGTAAASADESGASAAQTATDGSGSDAAQTAADGSGSSAGGSGTAAASADGSGSPADGSGSSAAQPSAGGSAAPQASSGSISESQAQAIALSQAGLTEDDVLFMEVKKDLHRGQVKYEVEFYANDGTEYSYDINAADGSVISYDFDAKDKFSSSPSPSGLLSEDQAKAAVLERVPGAAAEDIRLRLDEDDGRMEYEGWLIYDGMEYEFQIDAYSGSILEWEADSLQNP